MLPGNRRIAAIVGSAWLCGCARPEAPPSIVGETKSLVEVQVVARMEAPLAPAAWTAEVRFTPTVPPDPEAVPPGVCRRVEGHAVPGEASAERVTLTAPDAVELPFRAEAGVYETTGPRRAVDAAWVVGDLRWQSGDTTWVAEGVVRFGPPPEVRSVVREPEGGVRFRWDPLEQAEILATGPAGSLRCGVGEEGVSLPWWTVPARGGHVVLRTARERAVVLSDGTLVRARAVLERVIALDEDPATTVEAAGEPEPASIRTRAPSLVPRRIARPARTPLG
jgi:hypothetical protein